MLIRKVEKFLQTHNMAATKFGRLAARDPRFVLDLRMGRIPRKDTEARTLQWMAAFEASNQTKALSLPVTRTPRVSRLMFAPAWPHIAVKGICHVA